MAGIRYNLTVAKVIYSILVQVVIECPYTASYNYIEVVNFKEFSSALHTLITVKL